MAQQNFYETLGLQKGASAKEIKSAYYQVLDFLVRYCLYKDISTVSQTLRVILEVLAHSVYLFVIMVPKE